MPSKTPRSRLATIHTSDVADAELLRSCPGLSQPQGVRNQNHFSKRLYGIDVRNCDPGNRSQPHFLALSVKGWTLLPLEFCQRGGRQQQKIVAPKSPIVTEYTSISSSHLPDLHFISSPSLPLLLNDIQLPIFWAPPLGPRTRRRVTQSSPLPLLRAPYRCTGTLAVASYLKKPAPAHAAAAAAVKGSPKAASGGFMFFGIRNNLWKAVRLPARLISP